MRFLIPALIGSAVSLTTNTILVNRLSNRQTIDQRLFQAYALLTGGLAGIGAVAVFRKLT